MRFAAAGAFVVFAIMASRAAADWLEPAVPADGLQLWLRADVNVTADPTTNRVSDWRDVRADSSHVFQSSGTAAPILDEHCEAAGSAAAIHFDGVNDYLSGRVSSLALFGANATGGTVLVVYVPEPTAATPGGVLQFTRAGSGDSKSTFLSILNDGYYTTNREYNVAYKLGDVSLLLFTGGINYQPLTCANAETAGKPAITTVRFQEGVPSLKVGEQNPITGAVQNIDSRVGLDTQIGRINENGGYYFSGDIAEILVYNRALADDGIVNELSRVEQYLHARYAVPEPSTFVLGLLGVAMGAWYLRRR